MAATEKQLEKVESEMNAFERSTLRWTKATFVVFAGTMLFVALQWIAMRSQLAEMKSGGIDTGKLAVSAGTQAEVAMKTMHVDQRAWINVSVGQAPLQDGQPTKMPIRIVNTGKTPAYRVQGLAVINLLKEKEQPDFNYGTGVHPKYSFDTGIAVPNAPTDLAWAVLPQRVLKNEQIAPIITTSAIRESIQNGSLYIVVYGRITYDDIFGISHWTNFCSYAHNAVGLSQRATADTCGPYNDVDRNQ